MFITQERGVISWDCGERRRRRHLKNTSVGWQAETDPEMSAGWKAPDQGVCLSSLGTLSCLLKEKYRECISLQFSLAA